MILKELLLKIHLKNLILIYLVNSNGSWKKKFNPKEIAKKIREILLNEVKEFFYN